MAVQVQLKLTAGMNLEFIPGLLSFLEQPTTEDAGTSCLWNTRADGVPTAGTSIVELPERGMGSLGPFVTLTKGSQTWNCALTNSHVVRPPAVDPDDIVEATLQNKTEYDVSYFAPSDAAHTIRHIRAEIEDLSQDLEALEKEKVEREEVGPRMHPKRAQIIDAHKASIAVLNQKLEVVGKMPITLGRTLASSGRTIAENCVMDWALIELSTKPFLNDESHFVNKMPSVPISDRPFYPDTKEPKEQRFPEGWPLVEFGRLEEGKWYCKAGRTSRVTGGICLGVRSYCNWLPSQRQRWSKDGKERAMIEDGVTEEWLITTKNVGPNGAHQGTFCRNGDSGSGVVNNSGRISGLVYAGAKGLCGPGDQLWSGICSDIQDVKRSVAEKVPGAVLSLPA
ncbi:hypothetical protein BJX70DRAFT_395354 [Aspergillus crustosus]